MSDPSPGLLQVLGRARTADRLTTTARALQRAFEQGGRTGRVVALRREPGCDDIGDLSDLGEHDEVVLHTVDGGWELAPALARLTAHPITLVHHGSAPGSDRRVLRTLRGGVSRAVAVDPGARDELHALGFGAVTRLDPDAVDGALADVVADPASVENLAHHPGPLVLSVGPCEPNQSLELLLDAFAELVTSHRPSATLSVCGPGPRWYLSSLRRRIEAAGLVACELLSPATDAEVVARLGRAAVVVSLHPVGLDPFLHEAARTGVPIVAPRVAATAGLLVDQHVALSTRAGAGELATALSAAAALAGNGAEAPRRDRARLARELVTAFGIG